jgi:carbamoylphosphate synthase large subunit
MNVVTAEKDLETYLTQATVLSPEHPVVISKFIVNAKEIEYDGVAKVLCVCVCVCVNNPRHINRFAYASKNRSSCPYTLFALSPPFERIVFE